MASAKVTPFIKVSAISLGPLGRPKISWLGGRSNLNGLRVKLLLHSPTLPLCRFLFFLPTLLTHSHNTLEHHHFTSILKYSKLVCVDTLSLLESSHYIPRHLLAFLHERSSLDLASRPDRISSNVLWVQPTLIHLQCLILTHTQHMELSLQSRRDGPLQGPHWRHRHHHHLHLRHQPQRKQNETGLSLCVTMCREHSLRRTL